MTDFPLPQLPADSRQFANGFVDDGTGAVSAQFALVGADQLNYQALFGQADTSTTQEAISGGNKTFTLDNDTGNIQVDYTVQILSLDDTSCWMYGVVTSKILTVSPAQINVAIFRTSPLVLTGNNWSIQVIAGPFQGIPASQALGISTDSFAVPSAGDTKNLTIDVGKAFASNDVVYTYAIQDSTAYFISSVISYDSATGSISLFVLRVGGSGTQAIWVCSLQDVAGPDAALKGYSSTTNTLAAGDKTFTTQSGKFFPVNGSVFVQAIDDATVRGWGQVKVYTGTTLIITLTANGVFGSGSHSVWGLTLVDGSPPGIPFLQRNGLQVSLSGTTLTITAGSIRDSTNTYDLVLASTITKDLTATFTAGTGNGSQVLSSNLSGTITASGGVSVTGTSTTFLSDLANSNEASAVFTDYSARGATFFADQAWTAITANSTTQIVAEATVETNTAISTRTTLGTFTNATYQRGGWKSGAAYGVLLVRNDSTGAIDVSTYSLYPGSTPDLPSGWSVYGALAYIAQLTPLVFQWSGVAFDQISPMTSEGDMIYYHSGTATRLPKGSATQVLTSNGTDPVWATALPNGVTATTQSASDNSTKVATTAYADAAAGAVTGGLAQIGTSTPTAVATVSFTSIPATYSGLILILNGISSDTATRFPRVSFSTNNGSSYDTTAANYPDTGGVSTNGLALITASTQTAAQVANHSLTIFNYQNAPWWFSTGANALTAGSTSTGTSSSVFRWTGGGLGVPINAIRIDWNGSGNFDAGTITLYGIK